WCGPVWQPACVGELAGVDGGIAPEVDFDGLVVGPRCGWETCVLVRNLLRSECGAFNPAVVERFSREFIEVRAGMLLLPVGLHDFMAAGVGLPRQHGNQ